MIRIRCPIDVKRALPLVLEARRRAKVTGGKILVSVSRPLPRSLDPVAIFGAGANVHKTRFLLAQKSHGSWIVGVGQAAAIEVGGRKRFRDAAMAQRKILRSALVDIEGKPLRAGPLFAGCFRFTEDTAPSGPWRNIPAGVLILPTWSFACEKGRTWITMNALVGRRTVLTFLMRRLEKMAVKLTDRIKIASGISASPILDRQALARWQGNVEAVLSEIARRKVNKVTLARTMVLRSKVPIKPEPAIRRLISSYPGCLVFAVVHRGACFLGATPEELVSLEGNQVKSTCLAGSAWSSSSHGNNGRLSRELLNSDKEQREHGVVADWVGGRLARFCPQLKRNVKPQVVRLGHLRHLATQFTGSVQNGTHVLELVAALHPTPAVAGSPLRPAMETIKRLEDFDRGWYAGPVGWVNRNGKGQFGIAIRSALLSGNRAILFAGAGIVAGSNPGTEFEETDMKFVPLLNALGGS